MDILEQRRILNELGAPFEAEEVDWRVGSTNNEKTQGLALAYIDARTVADRLDAVMGLDWKDTYPTILRSSTEGKRGSIAICRIELKIDGEWIGRENGAGDTAFMAEKGALSDAFKRAATMWGIGRYLYGFDSPWVRIVPRGKNFAIAREEVPKLKKLAADTLERYRANPAAFRAPPVVEDPPERGEYKPAAQAPTRPEPPKAPPRTEGRHPLVEKLVATTGLDEAGALIVKARGELRHGPDVEDLEAAVLEKMIATILDAKTRGAEAVEFVAKWIGKVRPSKGGESRIRAELDRARREAQRS